MNSFRLRFVTGLVLLLVLTLTVTAALADVWTITVTPSCDDYNHVGKNWFFAWSINGTAITSGDRVDLSAIPAQNGDWTLRS